jgi:hypothetical protein
MSLTYSSNFLHAESSSLTIVCTYMCYLPIWKYVEHSWFSAVLTKNGTLHVNMRRKISLFCWLRLRKKLFSTINLTNCLFTVKKILFWNIRYCYGSKIFQKIVRLSTKIRNSRSFLSFNILLPTAFILERCSFLASAQKEGKIWL